MFSREFRAALAALSFLSRVPVSVEIGAEDVRRSGAYFPIVGAGIGALSGAVARRWGPPLGLTAETILTGALHLDALADSADGLGGRGAEATLEIMRDSRIGSFGVAAVCLDLMVRAAALERCDDPVRMLVGAGALSRALPVALAATLPYARTGGTGQALSAGGRGRAGAAAALAVLISADPGAAGVVAAVGVASAAFWRRRIGGVTGDTLGASIELSQAAVLVWGTR